MKLKTEENGPLAGIRVVDLSRLLPGPFCTWYLAALGAEVIRIERPQGGDPTRALPPFRNGESVFHAYLNRQKASVALDTKDPRGQACLLELLETADVVVESFRPGVMASAGLGPDALLERFPGLVVASITGYGQDGPLAEEPGHDLNFCGYAGVIAASGAEEPAPLQMGDYAGALTACVSIIAALFARERSGMGRVLDISMTEAALALMGPHLAAVRAEGRNFIPSSEPLTGGLGNYRVYRCRDGKQLCFAPLEPKFWLLFCEKSGFVGSPNHDELAAFFLRDDRDRWVEMLGKTCVTPALSAEEIFEEAHFRGRACFEEILGVEMVRDPFGYAATKSSPELGADTTRILSELAVDLESLYEAGVLFGGPPQP